MRPATYIGGMYPLIGEPAYPELWRQCSCALGASLGPTGLTIRDWSGRANHGTFTNMDGSDWVLNGGRYALDLLGSANQWVQVSSSAGQLTLGQAFSIACWCRPTAAGTSVGRGIIEKYYTVAEPYISYGLQFFNTTVNSRFALSIGNGTGVGSYVNLEATNASSLNVWHHVCGTYDGATMRIYVNGVLENSNSIAATIVYNTQPLAIGRWLGNTLETEGFTGQVDDIRIYSRPLSGNEIRLLASRRGIAYELAPRRRGRLAAFRAYWAARKALIQMAGSN